MWQTLEETRLLSTHKEHKREKIYLNKRPNFSNNIIASKKNNTPQWNLCIFYILINQRQSFTLWGRSFRRLPNGNHKYNSGNRKKYCQKLSQNCEGMFNIAVSVRPSSRLKIETNGTGFYYVILVRYTKICLATYAGIRTLLASEFTRQLASVRRVNQPHLLRAGMKKLGSEILVNSTSLR